MPHDPVPARTAIDEVVGVSALQSIVTAIAVHDRRHKRNGFQSIFSFSALNRGQNRRIADGIVACRAGGVWCNRPVPIFQIGTAAPDVHEHFHAFVWYWDRRSRRRNIENQRIIDVPRDAVGHPINAICVEFRRRIKP